MEFRKDGKWLFGRYKFLKHNKRLEFVIKVQKMLFSNIIHNMCTQQILGMVSVCAGCDAYYPWVAAILGCIAGV